MAQCDFFEIYFPLFQTLGLTDPCPVSALPTQRDDHVTIHLEHSGYSPDKYMPMEEQDVPLQVTALTSDEVLLACGGFGNLQCLAFDLETNSWQPHSSLDKGKM